MTVSILADAFGDVRAYFEKLPEIAEMAGALAINQVAARDGLVTIRTEMRKQINFPRGYLESRMRVVQRATPKNLQAVIRARDRATSLARFAQGQNPNNTRGRRVSIEVKRGKSKLLKKGFLVNLKNGNIGLAVRLKPGEQLSESTAATKLGANLYLLYGPSVDQVFRGVANQTTPEILEQLSNQFLRQFARLSGGRSNR